MDSSTKEVVSELVPMLRVYKDGTVERLVGSPHIPPSLDDPQTHVSSKDITISTNPQISARLFLPQLTHPHNQKLPILIYFHGGGFCVESAFSLDTYKFLNTLVSQAKIIALSVEYRLAPEHPLPIPYQDSWAALQWVCSHSIKAPIGPEPWLTNHADFNRVFVGGDSAGANIAHHIAMRAGIESLNGSIKIHGAILNHPYFWGSDPIGSGSVEEHESGLEYRVWKFVNPGSDIDDPLINPFVDGAPSLGGLGCSRLLVCVAGKDNLRDRGVWYFDAVKESGWKGEVELFEMEGEDHCFQLYRPESQNAKTMFDCLVSFLLK